MLAWKGQVIDSNQACEAGTAPQPQTEAPKVRQTHIVWMVCGLWEPGTGEIYFPRVYRALEEGGYQGYVGYELFPRTTTKEAVKAIMNIK